jgi:hypothetical protein
VVRLLVTVIVLELVHLTVHYVFHTHYAPRLGRHVSG